MKITRKGKNKQLKKACIYVWQEKTKEGINTYIDHIGDEEILKEYEKDVAIRLLEKVYKENILN